MGKLLFLLIYSVHTLLPVLYKESAGYLIDTLFKFVYNCLTEDFKNQSTESTDGYCT